MKRAILHSILVALLALTGLTAGTFIADFAVWRYRVAKGGNAYGTVTVHHYYAVLHKNGRTEFLFDPPADQTCVPSVFPHAGYVPCWYLRGHTEQRTNI